VVNIFEEMEPWYPIHGPVSALFGSGQGIDEVEGDGPESVCRRMLISALFGFYLDSSLRLNAPRLKSSECHSSGEHVHMVESNL
jgi:hypothetical protein